jgi:hypothetical protein
VVAIAALAATVGMAQLVDADNGEPSAPTEAPAAASESVDTAPVAATGNTSGDAASEPEADQHSHSHGESDAQYEDVSAQTQAELDIVQGIIERYPTAADAQADGWTAATINLRGIAAHFLKGGPGGFTTINEGFAVDDPEILLFDGIEPDAPIVGVSYLVAGETPEGFTGDDDVWHRHDAICFANGLVIGEIGGHDDSKIEVGAEGCKAQGGITFPIANLSMIHVWMKPGFPSAHGVFSHDHPELDSPES